MMEGGNGGEYGFEKVGRERVCLAEGVVKRVERWKR